MAKRQKAYKGEKRSKEIARQKKQEEKRKRRQEKKEIEPPSVPSVDQLRT